MTSLSRNLRRGWSKTLGGPVTVGAKWAAVSQSRGDAMSFGPRVALEFGGNPWGGTNATVGPIDVVASREVRKAVEVTGIAGGVLRADPDQFALANGMDVGRGGSARVALAVTRHGGVGRLTAVRR